MDNVTPTITDLLHREEENLAKFRRALRREDQEVFDDLFVAAYKHRAAAAYAGHLLPFETFLLEAYIEDHRELMRVRRELATVQSQFQTLHSQIQTLLVQQDSSSGSK